MTLAGKSGSIFSNTSLKLFQNSKNSRQKLKNRVANISKHSGNMEEENTTPYNFQILCKSHGIIMQTTTMYTPQQNGVAKRKNQTIMNMARILLKEKSLSNIFWAKAVACSVYLLNRSPTTSVKMKVPQEAWSGILKHLKLTGFTIQ